MYVVRDIFIYFDVFIFIVGYLALLSIVHHNAQSVIIVLGINYFGVCLRKCIG